MTIVVPIRRFAQAKRRLQPELGPEREAFARHCAAHVLGVLGRRPVRVVTDGDGVAALARDHGAEVVRDAGTGLPDALGIALRDVTGPVLVLLADLPWLADDDVRSLLAAVDGGHPVIAPDRHDAGTNALGLPRPGALCFGHADSFARHRRAYPDAVVVRRPGLAWDADSPADLRGPGV